MENLVTIATFDFPAEAETQKIRLEHSGIRAFLSDNNLVGMNWFLSNAVGGVKLQVAAEDADRANRILERSQAARTPPADEAPEENIAFACQECGKTITFPGERRGHVEVCPHCGGYVDVPRETDESLLVKSETIASQSDSEQARRQSGAEVGSRTTAQLWFEVLAVLCLAFVPDLFYTIVIVSGELPRSHPFVYQNLSLIIRSLQASMPLLAILALTKDRWSQFGIVRPKWIVDAILTCVVWFSSLIAWQFTMSLLPSAMLERLVSLQLVRRAAPEGTAEYLLLLIACIANGFAEELVMRGYLITRLERLLGSTSAAVLVSTVLFASYHFYQGLASVIGIAAIGLVYAISFCLFRRLWPLCLAHAIADIIALL